MPLRKRWGILAIPLLLIPSFLFVPTVPVKACQPGQQEGLNGAVLFCVKLTVIQTSHNFYPWLVGEYKVEWNASQQLFIYTLDPVVHVVNGGIDCIGFKIHGTAAGTTCSVSSKSLAGNQNSTFVMVSASGGHTPLFTDNACTATVATTNGFSITAGTYTAGTPSGGSAIDTLTHTWTGATGATSSLDLACVDWASSNAANTLYAMGQIGTTTVNIGDTLQTLWSFTYASS